MAQPINVDAFYEDGRGPELQRILWRGDGTSPEAIEYYNPDGAHDEDAIWHLRLVGVQAIQITPEEVINYDRLDHYLDRHRPAAMFDLGRSPWLQSFAPRHLSRCRHFQILFYDQLIDVICEGITCHKGRFPATGGRLT